MEINLENRGQIQSGADDLTVTQRDEWADWWEAIIEPKIQWHALVVFTFFSYPSYQSNPSLLSSSFTVTPPHHPPLAHALLPVLFCLLSLPICPACPLSHLTSFLSRLSLHAWIAAVILVAPSVIRGQCWNRCITGRHPTTQHSSGQALYHLSSLTAQWKKEK